MNPTQWQRAKPIYLAALDLSEGERAAYLQQACAGDAALLQEIQTLLASAHATQMDAALTNDGTDAWLPTDDDLPSGERIGHYQIDQKIGEGGMGQVYRARDLRLGRTVAIKILRANLTRESDRVRRFQQEARAASALNHPNILTIYEVGSVNELNFIATEFIEGQTLRDVLRVGGLTIGDVLEFVMQVGKALEAAHKAGIVHRDIKPENLMRRADGYVKVLDFGLAKLIETQDRASFEASLFRTRPGVVMGTITYMSPEQARGLDVDARTDVFSLGVVLYEMLTGCMPFNGPTNSDVIAALLEHEPLPLESHISGLPASFQQIIERALAKRVERRYANIGEMLMDLNQLKQDLSLASSMKRYGKSKSAQHSLLDMPVGKSTVDMASATKGPSDTFATRIGEPFRRRARFKPAVLVALFVAVVLAGVALYRYAANDISDTIKSVAVLPFVDDTGDKQLDYLPDGLTESLINNLSRLPNLRVMASGSVFKYKGRMVTPQQVGEELSVRAVISGRLQKAGDRLVISVEMADARDGARLWGERYERPPSDLLKTQNEIVRDITEQMRGRLSGAQVRQLANQQPANNEAYQAYLRARYLYERNFSSRENLEKSLQFFQQAIQLEPSYALAYAGQAHVYTALSQFTPAAEIMPQAKAAAERALTLDAQLADGYAALAVVHWVWEWNFQQAETAFRRAQEINPNDAQSAALFALFQLERKRPDEAYALAQRAYALDPLSEFPALMLGQTLANLRRYDEALAQFRKTQELHPRYAESYAEMAATLIRQGQLPQALEAGQRGVSIERSDSLLSVVGYLQGRLGQSTEARRLADELEQQAQKRQVQPLYLARIYLGLNERERALAWLQKGVEQRSIYMLLVAADPMLDGLRSDPQFTALLQQIGLPQ